MPKAESLIGVGSPVVDMVMELSEDKLRSIPGKKGGAEVVDTQTMAQLLENQLAGISAVKAAGGSAGNTTFALARLGIPCSFLGKVGADTDGEYYQKAFSEIGGETSRFKIDEKAHTARCLSLVTPDFERTMRTDLGAASSLAPAEISERDFSGYTHAHVEGYLLFNRKLLFAVLKAAKAAGCRISLDLASFEVVNASKSVLPEVLTKYVDIVFANEDEAEAYCGRKEPEAGLGALSERCRVAAVKCGKQGAWLKKGEETVQVPAQLTNNTVDTTGAGDFWAAGFLYGLSKGAHLQACGLAGALLGRHAVEHKGADLPSSLWGSVKEEIAQLVGRG